MHSLLEAGLQSYQLETSQEIRECLLEYIALLAKWNKAYNLTAVTDPQDMLERHLFDSFSIHSFINGQRCLDVGTGPGLPGLVLAIVQPDKQWTLLDSNQKKIRFLRHVKAKLQLENVNVIQTRVESYQDEAGFSNIVCRAFSSLRDFYEKTRHLVNEQGILLAMKAQIDETELEEVRPLLKTLEKIDLEKVGDEKKRCLIRMAIH